LLRAERRGREKEKKKKKKKRGSRRDDVFVNFLYLNLPSRLLLIPGRTGVELELGGGKRGGKGEKGEKGRAPRCQPLSLKGVPLLGSTEKEEEGKGEKKRKGGGEKSRRQTARHTLHIFLSGFIYNSEKREKKKKGGGGGQFFNYIYNSYYYEEEKEKRERKRTEGAESSIRK